MASPRDTGSLCGVPAHRRLALHRHRITPFNEAAVGRWVEHLTSVGAAVEVVGVAVVTGFSSRPHDPVAAACATTGVDAGVGVDSVPIIASFHTGSNVPITAACDHASVQATVSLTLVSIIAGFHPSVHKAIATSRGATVAEACVELIGVAIIALLNPKLDHPIAAASDHAARQAGVGVGVVAVIAGFNALVEEAVTAGRHDAVLDAGVVVRIVAVIAGFHAGMNRPIPAACALAADAVIGVVVVAIVTGFTRGYIRREVCPNDLVTAASALAVGAASVDLDIVSVVASFNPSPHHPIAAAGALATLRATIGVHGVPVITGFMPWLSRRQVGAHDAVTAARRTAVVPTAVSVVLVGVIAELALAHDAVPADHGDAGGRTGRAAAGAVIARFPRFDAPVTTFLRCADAELAQPTLTAVAACFAAAHKSADGRQLADAIASATTAARISARSG